MFWCLSLTLVTFGCVISGASRDHEIIEDLLNIIMKLKGTSRSDTRSIPAFTAVLSQDLIFLAANSFIKFDTVKTNIGQHYSPDTGIFTSPTSGLYMISATIRSTSGKYLHCELMVNDTVYVNAFGTNYSSGTLNVVVQLKKDDKVSIRKDSRPDEGMLGKGSSMFSGYLIA